MTDSLTADAADNRGWPFEMARHLARCSVLAYREEEEIEAELRDSGRPCRGFTWFECGAKTFDTQAFGYVSEDDVVLAFRGTKQLRDFLTDALIKRSTVRSFHSPDAIPKIKAHTGFLRSLDSIWSEEEEFWSLEKPDSRPKPSATIVEFLEHNLTGNRRLWLTGHSLGGALATLAAVRLWLAPDSPYREGDDTIGGLVTVGSPRVLNKKGARLLRAKVTSDRIFRIFRSADIVPAVPYRPYKHVSGRRAFVDRHGNLSIDTRKLAWYLDSLVSLVQTAEDRFGTLLQFPGQHRRPASLISRHGSENYQKAVEGWEPGYAPDLSETAWPGVRSAGRSLLWSLVIVLVVLEFSGTWRLSEWISKAQPSQEVASVQ